MKKTKRKSENCNWFKDGKANSSCGPGIYCLGVVGAAVYYIQAATSFGMGVWGVIKALLWPAFLIFDAMKFLGM